MKTFYSTSEVARIIGNSAPTVRLRVQMGEITPDAYLQRKPGVRDALFEPETLETLRLLANNPIEESRSL